MKNKLITISLIGLFSTIIWGFITLSGEYFYTVTFPLEFSQVPNGHAVGSTNSNKVNLSLKGEGWKLAQLLLGADKNFQVSAENKSGSHSVLVKNAVDRNTWITSSLQILEMQPERISFYVEPKDSQLVKIIPHLNLDLKPGYGLISNPTLIPDSVLIFGPASRVSGVDSVYTRELKLTEADKNFNGEILLEEINGINTLLNSVKIKLDIQKISDKEFTEIPVEIKNVPPGNELILIPPKISVVLRGGINMLGKMESDTISAFVNFYQAERDTTGAIIPKISKPPNTELINIKPSGLEYIIKQY